MSDDEGPVEIRRRNKDDKDLEAMDDDEADDHVPGMCDKGVGHCLLQNILMFLLLIGIIIGIVIGVVVRKYHPDWSEDTLHAQRMRMYLGFPGKLFLRMLKCMIIPLIVSSLISGMGNLPSKAVGKIGGYAVLYYMITTFIAVIIGIILVTTIKPGSYAEKTKEKERIQVAEDFILDLIRNVFPNNIIEATFKQTKTAYEHEKQLMNLTDENGTVYEGNATVITKFGVTTGGGTNVLGLVVFSIVLGLILGKLEEKGKPLLDCVDSLCTAIIEMVRLVIWFAPIGICFLLAERIVSMEDPLKEFTALGIYMGTVAAGLAIHAVIVLPIIYLIFARRNPFVFFLHMFQAIIMALGTASSSATLPVTLRCMTYRARVDSRIGGFVLPVGATINMDGTALYEAVASIFIAQINRIPLNAGQTITIVITSTAAAIGAAGVPEAGLVTMSIVLTAVGLPLEDVAVILAVDWLLDRLRTSVNVWGDSVGCGVVYGLTKNILRKMDEEELEEKQLQDKIYAIDGANGDHRISGFGHHNPAYLAEKNTSL